MHTLMNKPSPAVGQDAVGEAGGGGTSPGQVRLLLQVMLPEEPSSPAPLPSSPVATKPAAAGVAK